MHLICGQLKEEFDLSETKRFQPPVNADDLFSKLYFDLAISDVYFPTEWQRTQHETVRKMMTFTSARPGTLLWASGYCRKKKDALCWRDIELFMVIDPERPNCKVLLMRARH
ncbi:hypothetical protein EMCG_06955 [[Emmonsia] crescens]|uniref:Uncharacterized protein n=1 Tax=[Emmonsia] crescens TaxID=73230 RepID=A0A0G2I9Q5_9EURO|nr:hypothetical protein EMCG_06955 [Emmonsia crescens UAMH 3008]